MLPQFIELTLTPSSFPIVGATAPSHEPRDARGQAGGVAGCFRDPPETQEQDEREDRPRPGDDPAAVDRACAGLWIDPAAAAKASAEWERGLDKTLRCRRGGAAWAEWVGDAIRLAAHVPQAAMPQGLGVSGG